jgi:hypothetical protein
MVAEGRVTLDTEADQVGCSAPGPRLPMRTQRTMGDGEQPTLQVETLQDVLRRLLREREELRARGADRATLECNRQAIVKTQWDLSRALIARYRAGPQPA